MARTRRENTKNMDSPLLDTSARTTASSAAEGRLRVDVGGMKRSKRKILKKAVKDGKGGPGMQDPMLPPMGTQITPNTYTPQQKMSMGAMGFTPSSMMSSKSGATKGIPTPPIMPKMQKVANKPHKSKKLKLPSMKPKKIPALKAPRISALKGMIKPLKKVPSML